MRLDLEALDLVLECADLAHEVGGLVGGDGSSNDGAGNTAGATESHLGGNIAVELSQFLSYLALWCRRGSKNLHVGNVLVLAEQGNVQQNGQRSGIGSEDDNLGNTTVEGLGGFVGTLLQLAVVGGLLDQVEDVLGQGGVGDGPGGGVVLRHFW